MAGLGESFLREICYTDLIRDQLLRAAIYEVDGRPAGLIAYTDRSITFHRQALRSHLGHVVSVLFRSIARSPRVIKNMVRAIRVILSRRGEKVLGQDPMAEVVAVGVLPEFRSPKFIRKTGLKISEELIVHAARWFRSCGLSEMRMIVDADNLQTVLFYHSLGAEFEPYEQAGVRVMHVWFDLQKCFQPDEADAIPEKGGTE
jgi:ribosomal protein S18 acetylase RimI-like enzyme